MFSHIVSSAAFSSLMTGTDGRWMCADGRSGGDGWQTKKSKTWISGKVRAEKVLAEAVTIDGRKVWICKFCSKSHVWTRWTCRRYRTNIPSGLQGKHRQATFGESRGLSIRFFIARVTEKEKGLGIQGQKSEICGSRWSSSSDSREKRKRW